MIKKNKTLQVLYLDRNHFTENCILEISKSKSKNEMLFDVNLSHNNLCFIEENNISDQQKLEQISPNGLLFLRKLIPNIERSDSMDLLDSSDTFSVDISEIYPPIDSSKKKKKNILF